MSPIRTFDSQLQSLARYLSSPLTLIAIFVSAQMLLDVSNLVYLRSEITNGAVWRVLSGQLVHHNAIHLLLNIAGLMIVWLIGGREYPGLRFVLMSLIVAVFTGCLLYFCEPQLHYYLGFSGALHGVAVVIATRLMARGLAIGYLLGMAIIVKLTWEYVSTDAIASTAALIGLRVATEAHFWGAVSGLLAASPIIMRTLYQRITSITQAI
jgi:rhomboid family GlyGly-CTERM serine protease